MLGFLQTLSLTNEALGKKNSVVLKSKLDFLCRLRAQRRETSLLLLTFAISSSPTEMHPLYPALFLPDTSSPLEVNYNININSECSLDKTQPRGDPITT